MLLINEILADLKGTAEELAAGEITREEFNLKMDLLMARINRIEINFIDTKIHTYQRVFNQLLLQAKFKATDALKELQRIGETRRFNARVRQILAAKLYFKSISRTVQRSMYGYRDRHGYHLRDNLQIFTQKEVQENE